MQVLDSGFAVAQDDTFQAGLCVAQDDGFS